MLPRNPLVKAPKRALGGSGTQSPSSKRPRDDAGPSGSKREAEKGGKTEGLKGGEKRGEKRGKKVGGNADDDFQEGQGGFEDALLSGEFAESDSRAATVLKAGNLVLGLLTHKGKKRLLVDLLGGKKATINLGDPDDGVALAGENSCPYGVEVGDFVVGRLQARPAKFGKSAETFFDMKIDPESLNSDMVCSSRSLPAKNQFLAFRVSAHEEHGFSGAVNDLKILVKDEGKETGRRPPLGAICYAGVDTVKKEARLVVAKLESLRQRFLGLSSAVGIEQILPGQLLECRIRAIEAPVVATAHPSRGLEPVSVSGASADASAAAAAAAAAAATDAAQLAGTAGLDSKAKGAKSSTGSGSASGSGSGSTPGSGSKAHPVAKLLVDNVATISCEITGGFVAIVPYSHIHHPFLRPLGAGDKGEKAEGAEANDGAKDGGIGHVFPFKRNLMSENRKAGTWPLEAPRFSKGAAGLARVVLVDLGAKKRIVLSFLPHIVHFSLSRFPFRPQQNTLQKSLQKTPLLEEGNELPSWPSTVVEARMMRRLPNNLGVNVLIPFPSASSSQSSREAATNGGESALSKWKVDFDGALVAFCPKEKVADETPEFAMSQLSLGQRTPARMLRVSYFEWSALVSLKKTLLEAKLLSVSDVSVGLCVNGVIVKKYDWGFYVCLNPRPSSCASSSSHASLSERKNEGGGKNEGTSQGKKGGKSQKEGKTGKGGKDEDDVTDSEFSVLGRLLNTQIAEMPSSSGSSASSMPLKYQVGAPVCVRVLSLNPALSIINLTAKKSLLAVKDDELQIHLSSRALLPSRINESKEGPSLDANPSRSEPEASCTILNKTLHLYVASEAPTETALIVRGFGDLMGNLPFDDIASEHFGLKVCSPKTRQKILESPRFAPGASIRLRVSALRFTREKVFTTFSCDLDAVSPASAVTGFLSSAIGTCHEVSAMRAAYHTLSFEERHETHTPLPPVFRPANAREEDDDTLLWETALQLFPPGTVVDAQVKFVSPNKDFFQVSLWGQVRAHVHALNHRTDAVTPLADVQVGDRLPVKILHAFNATAAGATNESGALTLLEAVTATEGVTAKAVDTETGLPMSFNELEVNKFYKGVVKSVSAAGMFVSLSPTCLVRVKRCDLSSEPWDALVKAQGVDVSRDVRLVAAHFKPGTLLPAVRITRIYASENRAEGSLLQPKLPEFLQTAPELAHQSRKLLAFADIEPGLNYACTVTNVQPSLGIFVAIENSGGCLSALCPPSEIDDLPTANANAKSADTQNGKRGRVQVPASVFEKYAKGDLVLARLISKDTQRKRLTVGLKPSYFETLDLIPASAPQSDALKSDAPKSDSSSSPLSTKIGADDDVEDADAGSDDAMADAASDEEAIPKKHTDPTGKDKAKSESRNESKDEKKDKKKGLLEKLALRLKEGVEDDEEAMGDATELEVERSVRARELELAGGDWMSNPQTLEDFEKLVLVRPFEALSWIHFMSHFVSQENFEEALNIGRRGLGTVGITRKDERLALWKAMLNLALDRLFTTTTTSATTMTSSATSTSTSDPSPEAETKSEVAIMEDVKSFERLMIEGSVSNEAELEVLEHIAKSLSAYISGKDGQTPGSQSARWRTLVAVTKSLVDRVLHRFGNEGKSYAVLLRCLYKQLADSGKASSAFARSHTHTPTQSHTPAQKEVRTMVEDLMARAARRATAKGAAGEKFLAGVKVVQAQLEYKYGSVEIARGMFKAFLETAPKRLDLWTQMLDMESSAFRQALAKSQEGEGGDGESGSGAMKGKKKGKAGAGLESRALVAQLQQVRTLFEQATAVPFRPHKMKTLFKKWHTFETDVARDPTVAATVAEKARFYVQAAASAKRAAEEAAGESDDESESDSAR